MLAKALIFPKRLSDNTIKHIAVEQYCPWIKPGCGFKSVADFRKRMSQLPAKGGEWRESFVLRGPTAPTWVPEFVSYWHRDSLEVLKDLVGDVRLAKDMKWAPEKLLNAKGERLYSELWTADWWWRMQVCTWYMEFINHQEVVDNVRSGPILTPESSIPIPEPISTPESATIIPIILTSDKTHLAFFGKVKGWPILMTIGNISNDVRFVPGKHCAQLICLLPIIKG
jgi:Plavaka transposase